MKALFTKRNLFLLLFMVAFWSLMTWFVPYQKQFYLDDELKYHSDLWFWFIFVGAYLISAMIVLVIRRKKHFEKYERLKIIGRLFIWVFAFNLGFNTLIFSSFLGLNRIGNGKEVRYTYRIIEDDLAILVAENKTSMNQCKVLYADDLKRMNIKLDETTHKKGDVFVVKFIEGNFGFLYF